MLAFSMACGSATLEQETSKPPVLASARVDRAVATTGDVITYTVTIDHAEGVKVEVPEAGSEIAGFRIIDSGRDTKPRAGRIEENRWYQLRADLVGSYVLPAVTVSWWRGEAAPASVSTSEIFVEVKSVLPAEGEAADIRDVKPLVEPAPSRLWIWLASLAVMALVALAYFLHRRRRLSREREAPPRPADEVAFEALGGLRQTDFNDPLALRRYYFAISEVVRAYVEARFAINATDLTTEEILRHMVGLAELDPVAAERLRRFLIDTDRVKFAAHEPDEAEISETYERALSFVEGTRPRLEARAPAETEEKAA